jgi:hypothetical protein
MPKLRKIAGNGTIRANRGDRQMTRTQANENTLLTSSLNGSKAKLHITGEKEEQISEIANFPIRAFAAIIMYRYVHRDSQSIGTTKPSRVRKKIENSVQIARSAFGPKDDPLIKYTEIRHYRRKERSQRRIDGSLTELEIDCNHSRIDQKLWTPSHRR